MPYITARLECLKAKGQCFWKSDLVSVIAIDTNCSVMVKRIVTDFGYDVNGQINDFLIHQCL